MSERTLQEAKEAFSEWIDRMSVGYHGMVSITPSENEGCTALLDCGHTVTCAGAYMPGNECKSQRCWLSSDKMVQCEECDRLDALALK